MAEEEPKPAHDTHRQLGKYVLPVVAGSCAILATPYVLSWVGFQTAGIAAGSLAAKMMSASAVAHGGGVAAGSAVAIAQSAGAAGISAGSSAILGANVAATTAGFQKLAAVFSGSTNASKKSTKAPDLSRYQTNSKPKL